jgi:thiol-disulfide isomerase/thioredoxin
MAPIHQKGHFKNKNTTFMIKKIASVLVLSIAFFACQNENQFKINGTFESLSDSTIYLNQMELSNSTLIDSSKIDKKGDFAFKGKTEYPRFYQLALSDNDFITLLLKPGENVNIKLQSDNLYKYQVKGSPGSQKVKLLNKRLRETKQKLDSLENLYKQANQDKANKERLSELNQQYQQVINRQRDSSIAFILDNMGSLASIMALYQKIDKNTFVLYKNQDLQYIKLVADSLKERYPQSQHVKSLLANKEQLMKKYENMELSSRLNQMSNKVKSGLPDISLPNLSGDTVALSSLNDKMILLSFWASTNNQCVKRNLKLKKLYQKYHNKGFEIYQVSLDKEEERWKRGVRFDELPWVNVHAPKGPKAYSARIYNVEKVPADYLIKNGKTLVAKNPEISKLRRQLSQALN